MPGKGSDTTDCSGRGRGCDGTSDVRRRVRAGVQSFLCGDQGGDCSVAGSGGCHTLWRTERGWGGGERTPGRGVLSSQRGEHSEVPRNARGDAHRRLLWRKGWGGAETAGEGSVPAEGSGAGGSAWCSVLEEERIGAGKNPRRKSATPSTWITTQQAAKVPEPSRIVPNRWARIPGP